LRPVAVVVQGGNLHKFIEKEEKKQKGGGDKNLLRGCAAAVPAEKYWFSTELATDWYF